MALRTAICIFLEKEKSLKGQWLKNRSKSLLKTQHQLADIARKQATHTKHGRLMHTILKIGNQIKTAQLSYKAFQKNFGRSVGFCVAGMFIEQLKRKAENAGGHMEASIRIGSSYRKLLNAGGMRKRSYLLA